MARLAALLITLLAGIMPAFAAQFDVGPPVQGHQPVLLRGVIVAGDEARLESALARAHDPILALASPGGMLMPAIAMGERVRSLGLQTIVASGSDCALIWLAGTTRMLSQTGRIGLHAIAVMQAASERVETHAFDHVLRRYLTSLDYSLDTTATIVNTPAVMVRWMDAIELNAAGIATTSVR